MEKLPVERLSVEVLEKVFEFLPRKERKSGVLVNSLWRKAGEAPHLWTWVRLPAVRDQNSCARVIEMMSSKRLARVEEIEIQPDTVSEDLLRALVQHRGLKLIKICSGDLPEGLDSQLVIEALTGVKSLYLGSDPLPPHLLIALLTEVSQGKSTLNDLTLNGNMGEVPAALVVSALTKLVEVNLSFTKLTTDQVAALMEAIDQGNSSIERLSLVSSLPSEVERTEPLNLKPLVNIEEVDLFYNLLTRQELVNFFAALSPSQKLRRLMINNLPWNQYALEEERDGSTEVMAKAINFLEKVDMEAHPYQVSRRDSIIIRSPLPETFSVTRLCVAPLATGP